VELIYDADCPQVEGAREQLRQALREISQPDRWTEWDRSDPASPSYARHYGSPTVLVDGRDITGAPPVDGADCCRLYRDEHGRTEGVPPLSAITAALRDGGDVTATAPARRLGSWLPLAPAAGVSLLPQLACPACWPAYAGVLGAVGLGFLTEAAYLLPLTVTFLAAAVGALGFRAKRRRGYGPFAVGLLAAAVVVIGKFAYESELALYGGVGLLVAASLWNTWPRGRASTMYSRPACCAVERVHQLDAAGPKCDGS
jgi:hypothetical protein